MFHSRKNQEINLHLRNLSDIGATTSYTLLLRAFNEFKDDPQKIIELLKFIETFAIRRIICEKPTGELDNIYNRAAIDSFKQEDPLGYIKESFVEHMPDDEEFKKYFTNRDFASNSQTRYILNTLEEIYFSHGAYPSIQVNRFSVHIEHIMSRKFRMSEYESWISYLGIDEQTHDKYVDKIGNLTLLEERPNIVASNKPFDAKKEFYDKDVTAFHMTHELLDYDEWNIEQIKERSINLASVASNIWDLR